MFYFQYPSLEAQGNLPDILKKALISFDEVCVSEKIQLFVNVTGYLKPGESWFIPYLLVFLSFCEGKTKLALGELRAKYVAIV